MVQKMSDAADAVEACPNINLFHVGQIRLAEQARRKAVVFSICEDLGGNADQRPERSAEHSYLTNHHRSTYNNEYTIKVTTVVTGRPSCGPGGASFPWQRQQGPK
jgi:hypothetical protein